MRKKLIWLTVIMLLISACVSVKAEAYEKRTYARTCDIKNDEYEQILSTLRSHKPSAGAPGEALLYDTGVCPKDEESAYRLINAFAALYQGKKDFVLVYDKEGYGHPTVTARRNSDGSTTVDTSFAGTKGGRPSIYIGWLLDADADASLKAHDESWGALSAAAKAAPENKEERYGYYKDHICGMLSPQTGSMGKDGTSEVTAGNSPSEAYAGSYFSMCMINGDDCLYVPVKTADSGGGIRYRNATEKDGRYYWIDCFMADLQNGKGYFMVPVSEQFTEVFEGPYILK